MPSAQVFISCGQRGERETNLGEVIVQHFTQRGFRAYFAERVHSPEGLTENIFRALEGSEYFVFVDFKRERTSENECRGSLFVNQEVAIAAYLGVPSAGFVEKGIKREGILRYQIQNPIEFEDPDEIIGRLPDITSDWDPDSVHELAVTYKSAATTRGIALKDWAGTPQSDWYHIEVLNRHKRKHAFSCAGYIARICNRSTGETYELPTIELCWAAIGDATTSIMADTRRELDAFFVVHGEEYVHFHSRELRTTNPRYRLPRLGPGQYEVDFTIIAANFPTVEKRFLLAFDGRPDSIEFRELSEDQTGPPDTFEGEPSEVAPTSGTPTEMPVEEVASALDSSMSASGSSGGLSRTPPGLTHTMNPASSYDRDGSKDDEQ